MNSLDIRLDVVFENFVTSPVYLSLYKPDLFVETTLFVVQN